jgi:hypothetical protein
MNIESIMNNDNMCGMWNKRRMSEGESEGRRGEREKYPLYQPTTRDMPFSSSASVILISNPKIRK